MYYDVKNALAEATSFTDFQNRLDSFGIKTVFKRSSKSGELQGITFKRDGYSIKGSKLDRSLSLIRIMKSLPRSNKIRREEPHTLCRFVSLEEIQAMEAERQKSLRETKHESHMENPLDEYSKAFVEMRNGWKSRKDCKGRIKGMESEANRIKDIENILADYTEEELEVRKHKISIKAEQMARLVCYHPSTDQMVNYRIHTTTEGIVTKVEVEKKVKGKSVWMELKQVSNE